MPGAQWFPQARLNFAENLLRKGGTSPAMIFRGEDAVRRDDIAYLVGKWTGVPAQRLVEDEAAKLRDLENRITERVVGQDQQ